jgi:hypothetical protein
VAGGVVGTQVRLGLDDDAGGDALERLVNEDAAQEVYRNSPGVPVVEVAPQAPRRNYCSPVRSEIRLESLSRSRPASERMEDFKSGRTCPI